MTIMAFILLTPRLSAIDYLKPKERFSSPDNHWAVWVVKHLETEDYTAEFFVASQESNHRTLLATNGRHFGAEWSPDSKILLVYDNMGSGTSDTIIYFHTVLGWKKVYTTPTAFHIMWRKDAWLKDGVRLRSHRGGSGASEVPTAISIHWIPTSSTYESRSSSYMKR